MFALTFSQKQFMYPVSIIIWLMPIHVISFLFTGAGSSGIPSSSSFRFGVSPSWQPVGLDVTGFEPAVREMFLAAVADAGFVKEGFLSSGVQSAQKKKKKSVTP